MAHRVTDASHALQDLIKKSVMRDSGPPELRCLHTTRSTLDKDGKIRSWTFGQKYPTTPNKTILMVGETGTGKTSLINTMTNYYLGLKFEDKVWFEITEEEKKDQTESKTSEITVYEIFSEQRPESLTIIDTPGYGDTRGMENDTEIAENLCKLFLHETGVKSLDAVCLVLKSSQNRISERLHYIFEAVLSLFGKDIKDIVVLFLTHSDGGPPTNALEAVEKEMIPCCHDDENQPVHFLFNNRQSEKQQNITAKYQRVFKSSWEMGEESLEEFFEFLKSRQSKSLTLTVSVLKERMQLEACVQSLKDQILFKEKKQSELKNVQEALKQNKEEIEKDGNFPFTVKIAYKELDHTWYNVTRCDNCKTNCHQYFCWTAGSAQDCWVIKNDNCTGCKCHHSKHVRAQEKYETKEKMEEVTFEVLKQKYINQQEEEVTYDKSAFKNVDKGHDKMLKIKEDMIGLETSLKEELCKNEQEMNNLVKKAYETIMQLFEISLKPDSVFTIQYLDFLIPRVQKAEKKEWVQKLEELQKAATKESTKSAMVYLRYARDYIRGKCGFNTVEVGEAAKEEAQEAIAYQEFVLGVQ